MLYKWLQEQKKIWFQVMTKGFGEQELLKMWL